MPRVHVFSLKLGASHGLWQYKYGGTHDRVMMHGLRRILDRTCQLKGFDTADRAVVYLFHFSAEPFQGYQMCLEKMRETRDGDCYYKVRESTIGDFSATGLFPAMIGTSYLGGWPARIYCMLQRSMTGGIVN